MITSQLYFCDLTFHGSLTFLQFHLSLQRSTQERHGMKLRGKIPMMNSQVDMVVVALRGSDGWLQELQSYFDEGLKRLSR